MVRRRRPDHRRDRLDLFLTPAERHTTISVRATATRDGYTDASDTSAPTADIATELAPGLTFGADVTTLRRGQHATLTWTSTDADTLTAGGTRTGAWTGTRATSGTTTITPTDVREHHLRSLGHQRQWHHHQPGHPHSRSGHRRAGRLDRRRHESRRPAPGRPGRTMPVTVRGLERGEAYRITVGGTTVATGTAAAPATTRTVTVPAFTPEGLTRVVVTGSEADRTGAATFQVVRDQTLGLHLGVPVLHTRRLERVTVTGLARGERVTLRYRGRTLTGSGAHADPTGTYRGTIHVGRLQGTKTVTVTGAFPGRHALTTFRVRNR